MLERLREPHSTENVGPPLATERFYQGMVHHLHLLKDAEAFSTERMSINAFQVENGSVHGQAGPNGRHGIFLRPIYKLSELSPVWLLSQIRRPWLSASHDETIEILVPQIVNVG